MDIHTKILSIFSEEKIQEETYKTIAELGEQGFYIIGTNLIPHHLYDEEGHRVVLTYMKKKDTK